MARIGAASVKTAGTKTTIKPVAKMSDPARRAKHAKASRTAAAWDMAASPAYRAGEKAGTAGKTIGSCPHDGRTRDGKAWAAGYRVGQKVARKAKRA